MPSTQRVLEIGTGSGYQTAILAELARRVYSLEIVREPGARGDRRIRELGYDNVKIQSFDGTLGLEPGSAVRQDSRHGGSSAWLPRAA